MEKIKEHKMINTQDLDENTLKEGYNELTRFLKSNKSLINVIDGLLDKLNQEENFPFLLVEMTRDILPSLIGNKGTKFLTYILENGYDKFDLTNKIDLNLHMLVKKYGISYVCALKYINNRLDFVTSQLIRTKDSNQMMIRFIRSDKESLTFDLDNDSLASMISTLSDYLAQSLRTSELSKDKLDNLIYSMSDLLEATGIVEQADEDVTE